MDFLTVFKRDVHEITRVYHIQLLEILVPIVDHWHELHAVGVRCIEIAGLSQISLVIPAFVHRAIADSIKDLDHSVKLNLAVLPTDDSCVSRLERTWVKRDHLFTHCAYLVIKDGCYWALEGENVTPEEFATIHPTCNLGLESENQL